jgi:hypothetical protein
MATAFIISVQIDSRTASPAGMSVAMEKSPLVAGRRSLLLAI